MDKAYNHQDSEDNIYQKWEDSGAMRANENSKKPPFTIPLPPPNVTGTLHLGHAAMLAIEDIMIRFKKMTGHEALWVPGTDHAAIATENVVLKHLGAKSREEYSREEFLGHCRTFAGEKHDRIIDQMKKMGAWLDWSREAYTFDNERNLAVNKIFKDLYEDGLIVRGHRLINWSVGAQSVLSDDELEWDELKEPFCYIRCGKFIVGTVRPETKCADSPVIVHPEGDYVEVEISRLEGGPQGGIENIIISKYLFENTEERARLLNLIDPEAEWKLLRKIKGADLEGEEFEYETYAGKRKFFVMADEVIDMTKGTGAMTISCNHSADDYDLGKRRGLDDYFFNKIDFEGNMTAVAGPCEGMKIEEARKESGRLMQEKGLLVGIDKSYNHRIPLCYRSGCVVEPMISPQWFISVEKEFDHFGQKTTLKKILQDAVREGHVKIIPERFEKIYFQWIDNLQDWCISRQIWWGHQIPVWYDGEENIYLPKEQKVILARHGETENNANHIIGNDSPLTEKGKQDAEKLAQRVQDRNITKIISSGYQGAHQTALAVGKKLELEVEVWNEFSGTQFGNLEGQSNDIVPQGKSTIEYAEEQGTGESMARVYERVKSGWEKLKKVETDGDILLVFHRTIFSTLEVIEKNQPPRQVGRNRFKNQNVPHGVLGEKLVFQAPQVEGKTLKQDGDTLDTWFSAALWPFSTLGWPNIEHPDFQKFYPTDVLETGHDILFFWVARMLMFGKYATGKYPFHTTYLHGMVTDEHGKKMSKSKGNGIDPLGMIEKFGADPIRLALVIGSTPGQKIPIGENKIAGYRNFVNKLWNAGRFVEFQRNTVETLHATSLQPQSLAEKWVLSRFSEVSQKVQEDLENYRISSAGDAIYHFVWNEFCDWFIEASKSSPNPEFVAGIYAEILKLAHPLVPFVTEEIWNELYMDSPPGQGEREGVENTLLIQNEFPQIKFQDDAATQEFEKIQTLVSEIRSLRADNKLNPKEKLNISGNIEKEEPQGLIENLAGVKFGAPLVKGGISKIIVENYEVSVEIPVDEKKQLAEIEALKKEITALEGRLANRAYLEKAPETLVKDTKGKLAAAKEKLEKLS